MSEFKVGQVILIREGAFDPADCEVLAVTEKAVCLKSVYYGYQCWMPKGWLKPYKPGDESYSGEYVVPAYVKLNHNQERVLNISE